MSAEPTSTPAPVKRIQIGASAGPLLDFVTRYRHETYGPDDRALATFVGRPPGASRRRTRRFFVVLAPGSVILLALQVANRWSLVQVILAVIVLLVAGAIGSVLLRRMAGRDVDTLRCLVFSTTHAVLAGVRGSTGHVVLHEGAAGELAWGEVDVTAQGLPLVTFGGPGGWSVSLEIGGADPAALELVLAEAGIEIRPAA